MSLSVLVRLVLGSIVMGLSISACTLEQAGGEPLSGAARSDDAARKGRVHAKSVRVIDGDTLKMGGLTHRLFGIDSPEASQQCSHKDQSQWACGQAATRFLMDLVAGRRLDCEEVPGTRDRYGRQISVCLLDGLDVNQHMVANGHAWAYRRYSTRYIDAERQAQLQGLGIWQGASEPPWHVRRTQAQARAAEPQNSPDTPLLAQSVESGARCLIKGNISAGGRIFHLPGSRDYDKTSINIARGERWFCSVDEARSAGWRARRR